METDTYIIESPKTGPIPPNSGKKDGNEPKSPENAAGSEPAESIGQKMHELVRQLYPICRSITGNGVRKTLDIVSTIIPVDRYEIPTGTQVFDWDVPKEWNIREAWIKNSLGEKIVDFANSNLHILNYSVPVHKQVTLGELKEHIHTIPGQPELIPYRTSYYEEKWGFCMSHNQLQSLEDDNYEVYIDATLEKGYMSFGEYFIPGETSDEVLISTHTCHPSLANDNLSGIAVAAFLARELSRQKHRHSYRFLFIPGTIGAITWLSLNERRAKFIKHGLVASLLGRPGSFTYKRSRLGNAEIDHVVEAVLRLSHQPYQVRDFTPYGYDERQFCSPGFNLPVGCLTRATWSEFPEYHTSADNVDLVTGETLQESLDMYRKIFQMIEVNRRYLNVNPKCEPQLGKRGLYNKVGGDHAGQDIQTAMLWVLNMSDGSHTTLDICEKSGLEYSIVDIAIKKLVEAKLLIGL
jgi:aminopeptidase-like protein